MILLFHQKEFFRKNIKPVMTIKDKIRVEKPQYNINREATKTSVLLSGKINKYVQLIKIDKLIKTEKFYLLVKVE